MKHGGGECFFNDNNNKVVDSGILTRCKETESCIKDSNSSLGGICVNVDEALQTYRWSVNWQERRRIHH